MVVKANHRLLWRKLERFFASRCLFEATFSEAGTQALGHGRVETRQITTSADLPAGYTGFAHVQQVFRLTRTSVCKKTGQSRSETVYGLTSLRPQQAQPGALLGLLRQHWHIENKSHYVRDVTYNEDRSRVRRGSLAQVMAAVRNACIGLMRANGITNIAQACRKHAAQPETALALLGLQKTE